MSNDDLSFFEKMLENMGGIQDADGIEYRKEGGRNGASVARQLYRVIPKKDLADRILMRILKRYEEELPYKMSAWKYAHNINGEELGLELQGFGTGVTFIGHLMCIMQGKYSAEKAESVALENKWVVELDAATEQQENIRTALIDKNLHSLHAFSSRTICCTARHCTLPTHVGQSRKCTTQPPPHSYLFFYSLVFLYFQAGR